jgi:Planctomycete cytochrome C/Leucine Rich repeat
MPTPTHSLRVAVAAAALSLAVPAQAKLDFNKEILPLIESRCLKCHKAEHEENGKVVKPKGDIRLDAAWALLKGNKDIVPVVPKDVNKSGIVQVVTLPKDDDKFMPPEGKADPLTPEEILKLKTWIIEGADFFGWEGNIKGKPAEEKKVSTEPAKPREHDIFYTKLAAGLQPVKDEELKKLTAAGAQTAPLMPASPLLRVDFLTGVTKCTDESITALLPIKENIAHLDLARTSVTDDALKTIAQFPRITRLDLRKAKITDKGLPALAACKNLTYINLFGTEVTDAGLDALAKIKSLTDVYLYETKVTDAGVAKLKKALPKATVVANVVIEAPKDKPAGGKSKKAK